MSSRAALLKRLAAVEARNKRPAPTFVFQSFGETDAEFNARLREFRQGKPPNADIHTVRMTFSLEPGPRQDRARPRQETRRRRHHSFTACLPTVLEPAVRRRRQPAKFQPGPGSADLPALNLSSSRAFRAGAGGGGHSKGCRRAAGCAS
jgi:hypothetical protein